MHCFHGKFNGPSVITIGNFDGVHLGHQKLLQTLIAKARKENLQSVAIIFEPQPQQYFAKEKDLEKLFKRITTFKEKYLALKQEGVDRVVCLPFCAEIANLTPREFVQFVLVEKFEMRELIIGEDFAFGKNREGDKKELLKLAAEFDFNLDVVPDVEFAGSKVSSTRLRRVIAEGDLDLAEKLLGKKYGVLGRVVKGDGRGSKLGFPTANLLLEKGKLLPPYGVYVVEARLSLEKTVYGIANLGFIPTFKDLLSVRLEAHLLDFKENIYGKRILVNFLTKLRDEEKFVSADLLKAKIEEDIKSARNFIKNCT